MELIFRTPDTRYPKLISGDTFIKKSRAMTENSVVNQLISLGPDLLTLIATLVGNPNTLKSVGTNLRDVVACPETRHALRIVKPTVFHEFQEWTGTRQCGLDPLAPIMEAWQGVEQRRGWLKCERVWFYQRHNGYQRDNDLSPDTIETFYDWFRFWRRFTLQTGCFPQVRWWLDY